jgi:chondroitin AC lyase
MISLLIAAQINLFAETATISVAEDACVRSDGKLPDPPKLLVYNNTTTVINTYLKFDLSTFSSISDAKLKLTIAGHSVSGRNASWTVSIVGSDWTEGTITYAGRPTSPGTTVASLGPNIVTEAADRWMETTHTLVPLDIPLNITALQEYIAAGNTAVTFCISSANVTGGGEINIAAREAEAGTYGTTVIRDDLVGKGPKLEVTGTLATELVTLSDLKIDGTTIDGFYSSRTEYSVTLPENTAAYPAIVPTVADNAATVSAITYNPAAYNPDPSVKNTATFTVTNGSKTATYTITFKNDGFALIMRRIQNDNEKEYSDVATLATKVTGYLDSLLTNAAGRHYFKDIDYNNTEGRTHDWYALEHINRLKDMTFAYTLPGSEYYENAGLHAKIVGLLNYWAFNHPPANSNWWHNWIPEPKRLGIMLMQMRKGKLEVPADLETKLIAERMKPGQHPGASYFTGANRIDIATHWLYSALLKKDAALLPEATDAIYSPLQFTTGEGLQHDYSFFQHGQQLYIGGYGDEMVNGVTLIASYVAGTEFAIPDDRRDILGNFMRKTWLPSIRGQYLMWNITGRGMSREWQLSKNGASVLTDRMMAIDPANAPEYEDAGKRMDGKENAGYGVADMSTHFYRGDYTLHNRAKFSANVRLVSSRTKTIEFGNYENLKNYYLSDGSMNIVTHGGEYYNIFPFWDFTRIPGVTTPQRPFELDPNHVYKSDGSGNPYTPHGGNAGNTGTSTFAGGVSDGLYSITAFDYSPDGTYASGVGGKKGWFFFDDEIVCLGAGINSNASVSSYNIFTTLNQTHLNGNVTHSIGGTSSILPAQTEQIYTETPNWVYHDSVGYFFPQGGNVGVSNKTQHGNWHDINWSARDEAVQGDVFTLYIDHGKDAANAKYAYIVAPGIAAGEADEYAAELPVEILVNTDSLQVVYHKKLKMYGCIFFKAGTFMTNAGLIAETDNGCVMLIKDADKDELTIHVSDPQKQGSPIKIGVETLKTDGRRMITYVNPAPPYQGQSLEFKLSSDSPEFTGRDVTLNRNGWTIITSHPGPSDTAVGGDVPENIIDGNNTTAFLFVKPGKSYGGVTVGAGEEPSFTIDMQQPQEIAYLVYRHRTAGGNTSSYLRATQASFYGKNDESADFAPILEHFAIDTGVDEVKISFPKGTYRYVKFVYEDWDKSSGSTIQVSEFNLGATLQSAVDGLKPVTVTAGAGITVVAPVGSSPYAAVSGGPFELKFRVDANYKNPQVTINGAPATPVLDNGVYVVAIEVVNEELTIAISATLGLDGIDPNDVVTRLQYYNLQGQEIREPSVSGIYIVKKTYASKKTVEIKELKIVK